MTKLLTKLTACYYILFGKFNHWFIYNVPEKELANLLQGKDFDVETFYVGLRPYLIWEITKQVAETKDEDDMLLEKAAFQAEMEINTKE